MDPLFIVKTIQSKAVLEQTGARVMRSKLMIHAIVLLVIAIAFALFVLLRQIEHAAFFMVIFCMACIALALYRFYSVPRRYAEKTYSAAIEQYREAVTSNISVYRDHITSENALTHVVHTVQRTDCRALLESKDLFLIKTKKNSYMIIAKDGFSKGAPEEFRTFFQGSYLNRGIRT